jgi:hypothetical protein
MALDAGTCHPGPDTTALEARVSESLDERRFPERIELCGRCARRLFRIGPDARPYCEKCGHGDEQPTVTYARLDDASSSG